MIPILKHATSSLGLMLVVSQPLLGADVFSPINRVPGLANGGFNTGTLEDYEVDEDSSFAPSSAGDSDLGEQFILHPQPTRAPIRGRFYSDVYWSDNLASTNSHEKEGFFWANTIEAAWRPKLAENLFLDTLVGQDIYVYEAGLLNFQSTRLGLGLIRAVPSLGNLSLTARYEFFYSHSNNPSYPVLSTKKHLNDRFHRLRFGANRPLFVSKKDSVFLALEAAFDLQADPDALEEFEYSSLLGYTHNFTDQLRLSTFYRLAWSDYRNTSRQDWNQIIGLELSYALSEAVRCHSSLLYSHNDSNTTLGFNDFDAFQAGLGVGLSAKF